ncbi:MAG: Endonuclease/exonuclease/phosphatase [Olpidium bornovanus]|uniref:sphingomyelin phosphodiesterase n=1 Tax=Olpidium bornovanus TaxID=278681 RepID=A0A8H7ZR80_9FUNG|nr:MAG: Endonuclease/exonuclease/phosphatase [Olpidium bornovanus]
MRRLVLPLCRRPLCLLLAAVVVLLLEAASAASPKKRSCGPGFFSASPPPPSPPAPPLVTMAEQKNNPVSIVPGVVGRFSGGDRGDAAAGVPPYPPPARGLSVVSYNIYQMSRYLFPNWAQDLRVRRLLEIKFIRDHDVIVFQEAWDGQSRKILLDGLRDLGYAHQTPLTGNGPAGWDEFGGRYCRACPYSGGVVIVSKWEITYKANRVFADACGFDWFSNKGFAYARIKLPFANLHLIGTHMQSEDQGCSSRTPRAVRESQLREMSEWLAARGIPEDEPVIFAGDFNVDRPLGEELGVDDGDGDLRRAERRQGTPAGPGPADLEEYEKALEILSACPARQFDGTRYTWDPRTNSIARHINPAGPREYLDHVLFRRGHENIPGMKLAMSLQSALNVKTDPYEVGVLPVANEYDDISDHYPVVFTVCWEADDGERGKRRAATLDSHPNVI